jgi:hypothetical protein
LFLRLQDAVAGMMRRPERGNVFHGAQRALRLGRHRADSTGGRRPDTEHLADSMGSGSVHAMFFGASAMISNAGGTTQIAWGAGGCAVMREARFGGLFLLARHRHAAVRGGFPESP